MGTQISFKYREISFQWEGEKENLISDGGTKSFWQDFVDKF